MGDPNAERKYNGDHTYTFVGLMLYVGIMFMSLLFDKYKDKLFASKLNMLPISINEKYFAAFILLFMFILMIFISNIYNIAFYWLVSPLRENGMSYFVNVNATLYDNIYLRMYMIIPIFHSTVLASCVLFKKRWMTFCFPSLIVLLIGSYFLLIKDYYYRYSPLDITVIISLSLIFWIISYVKFRKIQLNK